MTQYTNGGSIDRQTLNDAHRLVSAVIDGVPDSGETVWFGTPRLDGFIVGDPSAPYKVEYGMYNLVSFDDVWRRLKNERRDGASGGCGYSTLGTWVSPAGSVCLDYGTWHSDLEWAMSIAHNRGEHSIYSVVMGDVMNVEEWLAENA
jgi:hypothetical protein